MANKLFTGFVVLATIAWAMGLAMFAPVAIAATTLTAGTLIKPANNTAVYYYGSDSKRYVFPHEKYYKTWYSDFKNITTLSADEIGVIEIGGNVSIRPGTKLVKFATAPAVYAVEPGSKLKKIGTEAAAKALYGNDWAKNVIDLYDTLYTNYTKQTAELDGTAYPVGAVVKPAGDYKYYVSASGWRKIASDDAFVANKFSTDNVVSTTLAIPTTLGTDVTGAVAAYTDIAQIASSETSGTTVAVKGDLVVSAAGTAVADYVSKGAQNAIFSKFTFTANTGDTTVSQILVSRAGLGYDADITTVRLYVDGVQLGTDQSVNTNTHKITFKNLAWKIKKGETKTLFVKANVAAPTSGTNVALNIAAGDVTSDATSISGLPLNGNAMAFSALTVGELNVAAVNASGSVTLISGEKDKEIGCWNLNTDSTEAFYVDSIKFTNIGSAADSEALNFTLKQGSDVIGTATTMSNGKVFVDMTAKPYYIDKSKTKKVCVYGDILAGITVAKTLRLQVAEIKDVAARGYDSKGEVLIEVASAAFTSQSAQTINIAQGSATLAQSSAYAPVSGTLVTGVANNKLAAYKLTAGATEGVKLTKLVVTLAGTGVAITDFNNWALYQIVGGAEVAVPVNGSTSGLTITFEDTSDGLLSVPKSENKTLVVKADVSTSFAGTEGDPTGAHIYVGANATTNTLARIKGLDSGDYITSGVTLSGVATGDAQTFTGAAKGTLSASKAASAPAANTFSAGKTKLHFNTVNLYATGEDMNVTSMDVIAYEADAAIANPAESADLTNVRLEDEAGAPLGTAVASVSSGVASFSFNLTVKKDSNKQIKVFADIPAAAAPVGGVLHVDFGGASDALTAASMTTTGVYSSADVTETGVVTVGSLITIAGPAVVASMATTPIASTYVINSSDVVLGTLVLTATTAEDVKITSIRVSADNAVTLNGASSASSELTNFELIDAVTGAQYGITQNLTDTTIDHAVFSGIDTLTVPKGTSKSVYIRADVKAGTADGLTIYWVGVADSTTQITGTGVASNTTATVTSLPAASVIVSTKATLGTSGTLTFSLDASNPLIGLVATGATGTTAEKTMTAIKAVAVNENADVTMIKFTRNGGAAADFATNGIKLYQKVGSDAEKLLGSANMIDASATFNFDPGTLVIEKSKTNVLIVKAVFNGTGNGVSANDAPAIDFADGTNGNDDTFITAKGSSSGATYGDDAFNSTAGINMDGNAQTLRASVPTFAPIAVGTAVANGEEQNVFAFSVTADSAGNVSLKQLKFKTVLTDVEGTANTLLLGSLKLYRGTTNLASSVTIKRDDGVSIESPDAGTMGEGTDYFHIYWTTEESIPAGLTYTYYLKGVTSGYTAAADDDSLSIQLQGDASAVSAVGVKYLLTSTNVAFGTTTLATSAGASEEAGSIIWSDNSTDAHASTVATPTPTSSGDWFNSYLVEATPSTTARMTN
ncbi:MAG: hypothetical protein V1902_02225 [Candidatus Falkowbacteria bacterium]